MPTFPVESKLKRPLEPLYEVHTMNHSRITTIWFPYNRKWKILTVVLACALVERTKQKNTIKILESTENEWLCLCLKCIRMSKKNNTQKHTHREYGIYRINTPFWQQAGRRTQSPVENQFCASNKMFIKFFHHITCHGNIRVYVDNISFLCKYSNCFCSSRF